MTRRLPRLLLLAALAAAAFAFAAPDARAGWWDDLDKGETVRLSDLFAQPERHGDRTLTFFCVLMGRDEVFFPLHTPFSEQRYDNVAVWDDGTPVWDETAYKEKVRPYLYIDERHPQRDALMRLATLTRIEVTARTRAVHRGTPFLEILSWRPTGYRLGEGVVRNVIWGDNKAREGNLDLAADAYRRALVPDLAPPYALQVRQRLVDTLRRLGRDAEAEQVAGGADIRVPTPTPEPPRPGELQTGETRTGEPPPPLTPPTDLGAEVVPPPPIDPSVGATTPFSSDADLPGTPVGPARESTPPPGAPRTSVPRTPTPGAAGTAPSAGVPPAAVLPPGVLPPGVLPPGVLPPGVLPPGSTATTPPPAVAPKKGAPPKREPRLEGVR